MDDRERQVAARTVYGWISEAHGKPLAEFWAWEMTPYPCGLPTDSQLEEGIRLATHPNVFEDDHG